MREIKDFFVDLKKTKDLTVVLILQDSFCDLIEIRGFDQKDGCLERFFEIAVEIRQGLREFWSDYIDPASGLPVWTDSSRCFSDVEACIRLLKMEFVSCGGCGMIKHERFGYGVYPCSFITSAPCDVVVKCLSEILGKEKWKFAQLIR